MSLVVIPPYVTNIDADLYFRTRYPSTSWQDASDTDKVAVLTTASDKIDRLNFAGVKTSKTQPREFPRALDAAIPQEILRATCEIAYALLDGSDPSIEIQNQRNSSVSLGDAKTSADTSYSQAHILAGIPSIQAWHLLLPFLRDPYEIRMLRDSFKLGNPQTFI